MTKNFRIEVVDVYGDKEFCFFGQNITIKVNVYVNNVLVFKEMPLNTVLMGIDGTSFDIAEYITDYEDLQYFVEDREDDYLWDGSDEHGQVTFKGSDKIFSYDALNAAYFDECWMEGYLQDYYSQIVYEDDFFEGIDSLEEFIEFITDMENLHNVGFRYAMCEDYMDYMVDIKTIDSEVVKQLFGDIIVNVNVYVGDIWGDGNCLTDYKLYDSAPDFVKCKIIDVFKDRNEYIDYSKFIIFKNVNISKEVIFDNDSGNDYSIDFEITLYLSDILLNNNISYRYAGQEDEEVA